VHGTLRVIGCVFDPVNDTGLKRLIAIGKFLHALVGRIRNRRKALTIARLTGAIGSNLSGIVTQFVGLRLLVATRSLHHDVLPYLSLFHKESTQMFGCRYAN
jgi:hypothetical protein